MSTQRGIVRAHARTGWALAGLLVASLHSPRANALLTDEIFASGFAATVTYYVAKNGDDDFSLIGAAPVGFVPFDLSASGRKNAPFTPPAVDPTFTIAPRDPATNF